MAKRLHHERGAVSIFIVIFTALLITIVTISFVRIMINEQQQATISDLSQSAFDSAEAGIEDAKRLLLLDQACQNGTAGPTVNCASIEDALTPAPGQLQTECNTLAQSGLVGETNGETIIQQSTGDEALNQAYTCVKIAKNTDNYLGELEVNESTIIPLRSEAEFDRVELSWFSEKDIASETDDPTVAFPSTGVDVSLPEVDQWEFNMPALLRAQVIQLGDSFTLSDFDQNAGGGRGNANTLFLYPAEVGATQKDYALDARKNSVNAPQPITCRDNLSGGGYACTVTLHLLDPANGGAANRNAYLRLSALYNKSHFSLALKNGANDVRFANVQPEVDSTGRANDLFRRIVARIELKGEFTFPEAELDITGNLCKNFSITSEASDYDASSTCTP